MMEQLVSNHSIDNLEEINGVGHRILHGGEFYSDSVIIDSEALSNINS